jgi:hypothetical protein
VEGPLQIGFLIDILSSNPEFVISNAADLTEVLIVFANYIKITVKKINEEKNVASLKRVKEILQQLGGCNLFFENAEQIKSRIPKTVFSFLENLVSKNIYV